MGKMETIGVKTLLGHPKKAIRKLSAPMMIGMSFQALYNLADGFWVAGLGANELAAIGLFFPFFMILISLSTGIGVGGGSAISRRIGAKNKEGADNTAVHTLLFGMGFVLVLSIPLIPFLKPIFTSLGGNEEVGNLAAQYATILFSGSILLVFSHIANAILRGEGDAKRAMYALILGSGLNIILDPIFIYGFKLGVPGAAWATLVSIAVTCLLFIYWLFIKKDIYLEITFKDFHPDWKILKEIFSVGIPAAAAQLSMSIAMIFLNLVVIKVGGTDGIAVFTCGWRIVMLGSIPLIGMAAGVTAVTAAAYGAREPKKLKVAYFYALKLGVLIELSVAVLVAIFANQIALLFTYSEGASRILEDLVAFLRLSAFLYPTIPFGMITSSMFRGVGMGAKSLIITILRTIILQVPLAYILGHMLKFGLTGAWLGIISGNIIAVTIAFIWGNNIIKKIKFN